MSLALESAKQYDAAKAALTLYLLTNPTDAEDAQNRLYALDAKKVLAVKEEANTPEAIAARQRQKDEAMITSLNGAKLFSRFRSSDGTVMDYVVEIRGHEVHQYEVLVANPTNTSSDGLSRVGDRTRGGIHTLVGCRFDVGKSPFGQNFGVIAEAGDELKFFTQREGEEAKPVISPGFPPYLRQQ